MALYSEGFKKRMVEKLTSPHAKTATALSGEICYLPVRGTYDEPMFHQLIARQRWHGVLLGRKALQLGGAGAPVARLL